MGQRDGFVAACGRFGLDEEARLRTDIDGREAELSQLAGRMRVVSRELLKARRRLAGLEQVGRSDVARFEHDYDALLAMPLVAAVEVEAQLVRVVTDPLSIEHLGSRFRIGRFAIEIDLSLKRDIRMANLDAAPLDGWDHPHVQGGLPCLGSLREGCEILLGELELVPLVSILLQFLEAYDPISAYVPVDRWAAVPA